MGNPDLGAVMIALDIMRALSRLLSILCGALGVFCFAGSFINGALALDAILFWACAAGLQYALRETA